MLLGEHYSWCVMWLVSKFIEVNSALGAPSDGPALTKPLNDSRCPPPTSVKAPNATTSERLQASGWRPKSSLKLVHLVKMHFQLSVSHFSLIFFSLLFHSYSYTSFYIFSHFPLHLFVTPGEIFVKAVFRQLCIDKHGYRVPWQSPLRLCSLCSQSLSAPAKLHVTFTAVGSFIKVYIAAVAAVSIWLCCRRSG